MNDKTQSVDYQEPLSIKVGRFLLSKGFDLALSNGVPSDSLYETCVLGILCKDPESKPRKYLFGLIKREPRRMFLGSVWFSNKDRGATEKNWFFEMYGRKHIELAKQLANEMASAFDTKVTLRLIREQPRVEACIIDYSQ